MEENPKNYGLDFDRELREQKEEDWVFGSTAPDVTCLTDIKEGDRDRYLPAGEVQKGIEDMMDCATRGPLNILEAKFNWLLYNNKISAENVAWLKANGYVNKNGAVEFSDAFIAILSGTTRTGNSLKGPLEAIHRYGLVPKSKLPLEGWMRFEDYHDPKRITQELKDLGDDFIHRFTINYVRVVGSDFEHLIKADILDVAGYAWPKPRDGEYPRSSSKPNHCFVAFRTPKWYIFDNYIDRVDDDFVKKLAGDYALVDYGYRVLVSKETVPEIITYEYPKGFWRRILQFIFNVLSTKNS